MDVPIHQVMHVIIVQVTQLMMDHAGMLVMDVIVVMRKVQSLIVPVIARVQPLLMHVAFVPVEVQGLPLTQPMTMHLLPVQTQIVPVFVMVIQPKMHAVLAIMIPPMII